MISRVAILTDLTVLHDGYSLTHVINNQVEMLSKHGHEVTVFVSEDFVGELPHCNIEKCIPRYKRSRYIRMDQISEEHRNYATSLSRLLIRKLRSFDVVFTHDWIFSVFRLPFSVALALSASSTRDLSFFHWIHSIPTGWPDWWNIKLYGPNHKIVYPNETHRRQVANLFRADMGDVLAIPHIVDLRTLFDFSKETREIIDAYPGLIQSTFVQVYPAARDRLKDKGLRDLILLFKTLNQTDSVCLLIVDSWTGKRDAEDLDRYKKLAYNNGLTTDDFGFISDFRPDNYSSYVPRRVLRELMQCSSLFAFPSRGESFGLCFAESSLAGGVLPVLNKSLSPLMEVGGAAGLYFPFGSCEESFKPENERDYFKKMASTIYSTAMTDRSWSTRMIMRKKYNMDAIYFKYYLPILTKRLDIKWPIYAS